MRRRSRTRRVLKWVGTTTCFLLLVACTGTQLVGIEYYTPTKKRYAAIANGAFVFEQVGGGGWYDHRGPRILPHWGLYFPYRWRPHLFHSVGGPLTDCDIEFILPLWIPAALAAIPTVLLWWRDRRFPHGFCQACGYDLTGNVSGRCPECGEPVATGNRTQ
jgi:hypothetical protein